MRFREALAYWMIVALLLLTGSSAQSESSDSLYGPPSVGNLKGVCVSIPSEYRFFPINYVGEDVWSGKHIKGPATFDTPIQSFSIRAKIPDMSPKTPENEKEWDESFRKGGWYPWLSVDIQLTTYDLPPAQWLQRWLVRDSESFRSPGWYYKELDEKRFGLTTKVFVGPGPNKSDSNNRDLLYDAENWGTIIYCGAGPTGRPGGKHSCHQYFSIPEINALAEYYLYPEDLSDWKKNQEKLTTLIKSFVVKCPSATSK